MIPVAAPAEPVNFHDACRLLGQRWLANHPPGGGERLPNYWRQFIPDLCAGFGHRCGYLAMLDLDGTVDHFLSTDQQRHLAYEWANYRYATGWLNSSKQNLDQQVLDLFQVREEWFEIDLASLHLQMTAAVPKRLAGIAAYTLRRLGLDYRRRTMWKREFYYNKYQAGEFPLAYLEQVAPLIATAVRREQLLAHLAVNPSVSRQEMAALCGVTLPRAIELTRVWRLAGHLQAIGRGRHVRYRRA
jgi:hypothetical protein